MLATNYRWWIVRLVVLLLLTWLGTATWAPNANAFTSLYNSECAGCHGPTSGVAPYPDNTCAGCHAHGVHPNSSKDSINITATPDSATYSPGDTILVEVGGSYRAGWVRVQMWDLDCSIGGTCTQANVLVEESLFTSGSTVTFPGPVTLTATAPDTPGDYTWYAGWYGNEYDAGGAAFGTWIPDSTNSGHGNELVTFSFTVTAPPVPIKNDFDGNGTSDVLLRNIVNGNWHLYLMDGATITPNLQIDLPTSSNLELAGIADFDGNLTADVLMRNSLNGYWHLYLMDGATVTPNLQIDLPTSSNLELARIADFDGTGTADVLLRNSVNGNWHLYLMDGATVTPNLQIDLPTSSNLELAGIADFDGTDTADVLFRNSVNGNWHLYLMDGATVTPNLQIDLPTSSNLELAGIADFDGTGTADVLLRNSVNGNWHLYLMDGATVTPNLQIDLPTSSNLELPGPADFDGNDTADVLLRNNLNGNTHLYLMDGATVTPNLLIDLPTSSNLELEAIEDFDGTGTGTADVLLRNSLNGNWHLYLMDGATVTPNLQIDLPTSSNLVLQQ